MNQDEPIDFNFADDIPLARAVAAHRGTSHSPDDRGRQEVYGYASTLAADYEALRQRCDTDEKLATLCDEFKRYRERYRVRFLAVLAAKSRIISTLVAGPANFPVRRMEKTNATADRRLTELLEFRARSLRAIRKQLGHVEGEAAPILASDDDAVQALETKLAGLLEEQERFKASRARAGELAKEGMDRREALEICRAQPFVGTNLARRIADTTKRIAAVRVTKEMTETIVEGAIAKFRDDPAGNRVEVYFPSEPDAATKKRLKSGGFRWKPSAGCYSAYRNARAQGIGRTEAGVVATSNPTELPTAAPVSVCSLLGFDPPTAWELTPQYNPLSPTVIYCIGANLEADDGRPARTQVAVVFKDGKPIAAGIRKGHRGDLDNLTVKLVTDAALQHLTAPPPPPPDVAP